MDFDRDQAERELTALLNRALRFVPYVRLDCVDDVTALFQRAVDLMEHNLILSDSEDESNTDETGPESDEQSTDFQPRSQLMGMAQKLIGAAITKDFSSPSASKRSLGGQSKPSNSSSSQSANPALVAAPRLGVSSKSTGSSLGLGLGKSQPPIAQIAPNHKPSSRATAGLAAQNQAFSTDDDNSDETSTSSTNSNSSDEPTRSRSEMDSEKPRVPLNGGPKNKLLTRATMASSKEFPSPKLGPRSLGGESSGRAVSAPAAKDFNSIQPAGIQNDISVDDFESGVAAATFSLPEAAQLGKPRAEITQSPVPKNGSLQQNNDIVDSSLKSAVDRVKHEIQLPVTASPIQFKSSLHLLNLVGRKTHDSGDLIQEGTPKPDYLRRLDSPDSHHGQLINAKSKLSMLINRALQNVPQLKSSAMGKIRDAIEKAVEKLEESTVAVSQS